ncbi:MAG: PAS domain S-box protein, partial [Alphaproteobacteria bacterium]|nr:PAS domain S-box protein [Alphaproteobacteria bacterium]
REEVTPDLAAPTVAAEDLEVLTSGEAKLGYERLFTWPDREPKYWLTSKLPMFDDHGAVSGILTVDVDITARKRQEQEIAATRALLDAVFDAAPVLISVKDHEGRYRLVNRARREVMGLARDAMLGATDEALGSGAFADLVRKMDRQVIETGKATGFFDNPFLTDRSGRPLVLMTNKVPLRDADGRFEGILSVSVDVTEMRRVQAALAASNAILRSVIDLFPGMVSLKDRDRRFVLVNRGVALVHGIDADAFLGKTREEVTPDLAAPTVAAEDLEVLTSGEAKLGYERLFTWPDREPKYWLTSKLPMFDDHGAVSGILTVDIDITARKRQEQEIVATRALLDAVFDAAPVLITVKDLEGRYRLVNRAMFETLGAAQVAVVGATVEIAVSRALRDLVQEKERQVLASGEATGFFDNAHLVDKNGRPLVLMSNKVPLRDSSGRIDGILTVSIDVTEMRRVQAALESNRSMMRAVLDALPTTVAVKDPDRRYILVNSKFVERFGGSTESWTGKTVYDLPADRDHAEIDRWDQAVLTSGIGQPFQEWTSLSGAVTMWSARLPWKDSEGRPAGVITVELDISERKRLEREAEANRRLLQTVIDAVPARINVKDRERRFVLANRAQAEAFGLTPAEIVGKKRADFALASVARPDSDSQSQEIDRLDRVVISTGTVVPFFEELLRTADGEIRASLLTKLPLRGEGGKVDFVLSVGIDISERKRLEREAEESRRLMQALLDGVPARIYVKDLDLRYRFVNRGQAEYANAPGNSMIGRRREDFGMGRTSGDRANIELALARDREVIETGRALLLKEEVYRPPSGDERTSLVSKLPLRDAEGRLEGLISVSLDITERKRLEREAEANRQLLQTVIDAVPARINVKDRERRFVLANRAQAEAFGLTPAEIVGKKRADFALAGVARPDSDSQGQEIDRLDRLVISTGTVVPFFEELLRTADGEIRASLMTKLPLRGPGGEIEFVLTVGVDISERKRDEQTIQEVNRRLADYAEISSDWFWETDADHRLSYLSEGARQVLLRPERYIGHRRGDGSRRPEAIERFAKLHADMDAHRPIRDFVYRVRPEPGRHGYVSVSGKALFDRDGKFFGYRGTSRDVTRQIELQNELRAAKEAADAANQAKSTFLANMSHELRTPLNAVIGFAEMLDSGMVGELSERHLVYVRDIAFSGRHLLELINDILDLAKIEAGRVELEEGTIVVPDLVAASLRMVRERANQAGIALGTELAPDLPSLRGDTMALRKVLINLLSNAIKFTDPGGQVAVRANRHDGVIDIVVVDSGIGIAAEDLPRVVEPFGQVKSVLTRNRSGTGLGLPIAKSLTELHGGKLLIASQLGRGTSVTIRLPAGRALQ